MPGPANLMVVDHTGQRHSFQISLKEDVALLRQRIMRMPWIHQVSPAWTIHGGKGPKLRATVVDRWTGQPTERELEDGDILEDLDVQAGTIIEPVFDCDEYTTVAFESIPGDIKAGFLALARGLEL